MNENVSQDVVTATICCECFDGLRSYEAIYTSKFAAAPVPSNVTVYDIINEIFSLQSMGWRQYGIKKGTKHIRYYWKAYFSENFQG